MSFLTQRCQCYTKVLHSTLNTYTSLSDLIHMCVPLCMQYSVVICMCSGYVGEHPTSNYYGTSKHWHLIVSYRTVSCLIKSIQCNRKTEYSLRQPQLHLILWHTQRSILHMDMHVPNCFVNNSFVCVKCMSICDESRNIHALKLWKSNMNSLIVVKWHLCSLIFYNNYIYSATIFTCRCLLLV